MYDITVEGEHEFVAGGVVVHNCSVEDLYARGKDFHLPDSVCSAALAWKLVSHKFPAVDPVGLDKGENWMAQHVEHNTPHLGDNNPYRLEGEVRSSEDVDELSFT